MQVKVRIKLANCFSQVYQQFSANTKTIELLGKDNNIRVIVVLIQVAQWLQKNHLTSGVEANDLFQEVALHSKMIKDH